MTLTDGQELAAALSDEGLPTTSATLATWASRGEGPPYLKYGRYVRYRWGTSLRWAKDRLTPAAERRPRPLHSIGKQPEETHIDAA